jgi:hypothetical protein
LDRVPQDGDRHAQLALEGCPVEAREDGHRDDPRAVAPGGPGCLRRGPQHRGAARGVHGEEPDAQPRGRLDGARHRRRDVVVLEVEEDASPPPPDHLHRGRAGGGEERAPHLEVRDDTREPIHERLGSGQARGVEGDDQAVARREGPRAVPTPGHVFRLS